MKFEGFVTQRFRNRPGFSLLEVLFSIFILGIGLIMVASVFPVGAEWTRQTAETSVAQAVAQQAISVIKTYYGPGGTLGSSLNPDFMNNVGANKNLNTVLKANFAVTKADYLPGSPAVPTFTITPFVLQALPRFTEIPPSLRAYQFGSTNPFPASNPTVCTYFWTALIRLDPIHMDQTPRPPSPPAPHPTPDQEIVTSPSYKYDVYIFVFRKGAVEHVMTYTPPRPPNVSQAPLGCAEIPSLMVNSGSNWADQLDNSTDGQYGTRGANWNNPTFATQTPPYYGFNPTLLPNLVYTLYQAGSYDPSQTPAVTNAIPPVGQIGVGAYSGTIFRQVVDSSVITNGTKVSNGGARPSPLLLGQTISPTNNSTLGPVSAPPQEPIIYAPAADNTVNSATPLIYVYETTMTF